MTLCPRGPRESRPIQRKVSLVLSALLLASPARSADDSGALSVESLTERFAAPGGPGFVSDLHMGPGMPFAFLGLVAGGVALRDGLLPETRPWPGLGEIAAPRAWYDSTAIVVGEGAGWRGFSASLVELQGIAQPPVERKPRAAFTYVNGTSALDRTGLLLSRGGDDSWARGGALTEERSGAGLLGRHGQHVWFAQAATLRGAHTFSGTFSQRGASGGTRFVDLGNEPQVPPYSGLTEDARGESGAVSWRWERPACTARVELSRSHDHRESSELRRFDPFLEADVFHLFSEREAQDDAATAEITFRHDTRSSGLRLELHQSQVRRSEDQILTPLPAVEHSERSAWLAARDERPFGGGSLTLELGGGHARSPVVAAERWQMAPSLAWRVGPATRRLRLYAERVVTPVWSDLAPGVNPFVQDTWVAGGEVSLGDPRRQWLRAGALGAEIGNRAGLVRFPVRDIALRLGWTPEGVRVQDGMVTLDGGLRRGAWAIEASGFARVRPAGTQPTNVDPKVGARAAAETGFRVFAGDLGVTVRFESAWVGERENESLPGYFTPPRSLPGYATFGGSAAITLGDARIVVRATNLEDVPHPQVWTDPSSPFPGVPAAGTARQFRVELAWPFFN